MERGFGLVFRNGFDVCCNEGSDGWSTSSLEVCSLM